MTTGFDGLRQNIAASTSCIWLEKMFGYQKLSTHRSPRRLPEFVLLNSSGSVEFFVPTVTSIACKIKIHDFPFDVQTCTIKVMAQTFIARQYAIEAKFFTTNASRIAQMGVLIDSFTLTTSMSPWNAIQFFM
ncbi:hypothetical protein OSTOST_24730, partial [Ostertagia ostertagi]